MWMTLMSQRRHQTWMPSGVAPISRRAHSAGERPTGSLSAQRRQWKNWRFSLVVGMGRRGLVGAAIVRLAHGDDGDQLAVAFNGVDHALILAVLDWGKVVGGFIDEVGGLVAGGSVANAVLFVVERPLTVGQHVVIMATGHGRGHVVANNLVEGIEPDETAVIVDSYKAHCSLSWLNVDVDVDVDGIVERGRPRRAWDGRRGRRRGFILWVWPAARL